MKKKLYFLDLATHKNTHSGVWLQELLRRRFDVTVHYATSRNSPDMCTKEDVEPYDVILYFQITPIVSRAASFDKPSIYMPMYDSETYNRGKWMRIKEQNAAVVSFTEKEGGFIRPLGIPTLNLKYFTPLVPFSPGDPLKLFLWDRGFIHFEHIKQLFRPGFLKKIILRCNASERAKISQRDISDYHVEIIPQEQYASRDAYLKMYEECGLFVAPRSKEGIGLSYIEPMMRGKCVIAHDDATMNEYLTHMKTGILVDFKRRIESLDLTEDVIRNIQVACYAEATRGYEEWKKQEDQLLDFVEDTIRHYRSMSFVQRMKWHFLFPYHLMGDVRSYFRMKIHRLLSR